MKSRKLSRRTMIPLAALASAIAASVPTNTARAQSLWWDINGATSGAGGTTPSGSWDLTSANWNGVSTGIGLTTTWTAGDTALFSAGADATGTFTVTIPSNVTIPGVNGITFEEGNITVTGGSLVLTDPNISTLGTHTIASSIGGTVGLTRASGTLPLTLSGSNSYTGATQILTNGRVVISNGNALGPNPADMVSFNPLAATTSTFSGMGLSLLGNITVNKSIILNGGSGTTALGQLDSTSGNNTWAGTVTLAGTSGSVGTGNPEIGVSSGTLTITGPIVSGAAGTVAAFSKTGIGTLVLAGSNSFSSINRILGGTVVVTTDGAPGNRRRTR